MIDDKVYGVPNPTAAFQAIIFNPDLCRGCNQCVEVCRVMYCSPMPSKVSRRWLFILTNAGFAAAAFYTALIGPSNWCTPYLIESAGNENQPVNFSESV